MPKNNELYVRVNGRTVAVDNRIVEYKSVEITSLEELIESGEDYPDECESIENTVLKKVMIDKLHHALQTQILSDDEKELIKALYFSNDGEGMSERKYATICEIPRKTIAYRREVIFDKLRQFLQD